MALFPFSPAGVKDKLTQLYDLPDASLALDAEAVKTDFRHWIEDSFTLSQHQKQFLSAISNEVATNYGELCSICFTSRLEIQLVVPVPPESPGYAKWVAASNTIDVKTDGTGNSSITGKLTFTISYTPV